MISGFKSTDGKNNIYVKTWPVENPVAVLQIVHGMCENIDRYDRFAQYLNGFGIYVVGHDHLGHGKTAACPEDLGFIASKDGWNYLIDDAEYLRAQTKAEFPDIPYVFMGHSMGSFVARAWTRKYGAKDVDALIYMGTMGSNPALGAAKALVAVTKAIKGERYRSQFLKNLAFGAYLKNIENPKSPNSWVSRDEAEVDKYDANPFCTFMFTAAAYEDLFNLCGYIQGDAWANTVPKDIPILVIAGGADPVGSYGKGPAEVAERLQKAGCEDVSLLIYEGMRHEILNEIGRDVVMSDVKRFILGEEQDG